MKLLGRKLLEDFCRSHADARNPVDAWAAEVEEAHWKDTMDVKARYPNASFLHGSVVVFNIKGNSYRLVTKVEFVTQVVLATRIGTHAEYSRWSL